MPKRTKEEKARIRAEGREEFNKAKEAYNAEKKNRVPYRDAISNPIDGIQWLIHAGKQIGNAFNMAKGGWKAVFNHPEWYSANYGLLSPIGINYADDKANPVFPVDDIFDEDENVLITSAEALSPSLIMDYSVGLSTYVNDDSRENWNTAIQLIYNDATARSGRKPEYSIASVGKYIHNVRCLYAALSHLTKLFAYSFEANYADTSIPKGLFHISGIDITDWSENLGTIRDTLRFWWNQLVMTYPINCNLIDRTKWLFGNIFADSTKNKPTYIVNRPYIVMWSDLDDTSDAVYAPEHIFSPDVNTRYTWSEIATDIEAMFDKLEDITYDSEIRSDLERVLNIHPSYANDAMGILNEPIPQVSIVYDEHYLHQLENATIPYSEIPYVITSRILVNRDGKGSMYFGLENDLIPGTMEYAKTFVDIWNNIFDENYINGSGREGEKSESLCSITRLATIYDAAVIDTDGDGNDKVHIQPISVGTEQVLLVRSLVIRSDDEGSREYAIFNLSLNQFLFPEEVDDIYRTFVRATTVLSNVAYAPALNWIHMNINGGTISYLDTGKVWDFDAFARLSSNSAKSFNAKAVYSLLVRPSYTGDKPRVEGKKVVKLTASNA